MLFFYDRLLSFSVLQLLYMLHVSVIHNVSFLVQRRFSAFSKIQESELQDQVNHIYMYKFEPCFILYIHAYSNNVVQKLPCHMAIIQNSVSKRTSVCTHMNKKINLCTCPLYSISSYPLFCCHCQSLRRSWSFFCDCSLVIPIAEEEG